MAGETVPSVCHRLPSGAKLGLTFAVVLMAVLIPPESWPLSGLLFCVIFAGQTLANIPMRYLLRRLMLFLPPVVLVALSFPMSQGFQAGWSMSAAIVIRSSLALMAGIWMVHVLPIEELLKTLKRYKVPMVLIATLAFAYRYVFVLWEELDKMRTARRARSFGNPSLWTRWKISVQLLGMLLLRALNRAERVHGAMCARGWDGEIRTLEASRDSE
jgi:cobalt/nickel transport system permease protein